MNKSTRTGGQTARWQFFNDKRVQLIKNRGKLLKAGLAGWSLYFLLTVVPLCGLSQPNLPPELDLSESGNNFHDYLVPTGIRRINFQIAGARGDSYVFLPVSCVRFFGGRGALISASFLVGNYSCPTGSFVLQPGGTIRFIVGRRGRWTGNTTFLLSAGGGGSAVLYRAPGSQSWEILMVAGGGGGAGGFYNQVCGGFGGRDAELGPNGSGGNGPNGGAGGTNGGGGAAGGIVAGDGGGGGGAFSGGGNGLRTGIAGGAGGSTGAAGGQFSDATSTSIGGYGFGGGGAGIIAGGGGGGYSGGGGGGKDGTNPGGGGGGGSFVREGAFNVSRSHHGTPGELTTTWPAFASATTEAGAPFQELRRIFVNQEAPTSSLKNGTSWANAFTDLQDALIAANNTCQAEIWVARGTYLPDRGVGFTRNNRNHSFVLKSGVAIYGGFNGTETNLNERNWRANRTILSGDLAQNNFTFTFSNQQYNNYGDNSFHVVRSENTNNTAILDGFLVQSGNANGSFPDNSGGGIYSVSSAARINNCTVSFNQAVQGGGLYNAQSSPFITNCAFSNNVVTLGASGVYIINNSNPFFYNCVFQGNYVGTLTPDGGGGGAILNAQNSRPEFINCTISGNSANTGGAVYNLQNARPIFYNSIIWQNRSNTAALRISSDGTSGMQYRNCLVQGVNLSGANGNLDGTNEDAQIFLGNDNPNQAPNTNAVLFLRPCSPAIDMGNNGFLANPTDFAGNPRFNNGTVDLGAFEAGRVYVNMNATGANNGTTWANAFRSLQDAIAFAGECPSQIWVARGTYTPTNTTDRNAAFTMRNNVGIFGGFTGNETDISQRNWQQNPTILSGDIGIVGNRTDNSLNVIRNILNNLNTTAILDGFIIRDGQADRNDNSQGGGMLNMVSAPVVRNCIFTANLATTNGGAVFNLGALSAPIFENCIFSGNQAQTGGGLYNNNAQSRIINCTFTANQVSGVGGGVYNIGTAQATMVNSIVWGNSSIGLSNAFSGTTAMQVTHSIVEGGYTGTGNSNQNPLFVTQAPIGLGQLGDLRLQPCSPAINAGSNGGLVSLDGRDFAGQPRIMLTTVDMGVFEFSMSTPAQIIYVNAAATSGTRTGQNWANAFTSLQSALALNCTGNTQIWVARGTYRPTTGTNRDSAFVMRNNQPIYGGFAGTETELGQRDWRLNETILSGDIGQSGNRSDNSHNVIFNNNNGLNASAILDGFIIRDGQANKAEYARQRGGGMFNLNSSPTIRNCIFTGNFSSVYGGAVFNQGATATPTFINCVFSGNQAEFGGGIFNESAQTQVFNSTFSANQIAGNGGGIYSYGTPRVVVRNSIFWGNANNGVFTAGIDNSTPIEVTHSLVQGGYAGTGNINQNPLFAAPVAAGLGQLGNLRLQGCSPAINTGLNSALPAGTDFDLAGLPRIVLNTVDMGAYELQTSSAPQIIYVNAAATGTQTGQSWANAFSSLQIALAQNCMGNMQIWVARGTYRPATGTNRDSAFVMRNNTAIYGGFAGNEAQLSQRNWRLNPTILSGDIGVAGNRSDNSYNVIRNDNNELNATAILDGFIIRDGQADKNEFTKTVGAGMFNNGGSPQVINCIFTNNQAAAQGGGVYNAGVDAVSPTFVNCVFSGNGAASGGGLYNANTTARLVNCTFSANDAGPSGGAIFIGGFRQLRIINCIIWGNSSGMLWSSLTDIPFVINNSIVQSGNPVQNQDPRFHVQAPIGLGQMGDLRLLGCSPARDLGSVISLPFAIATDLAGFSRFRGNSIDAGAYERQAVGSENIYIDLQATGANDGTDWANAFNSLPSALAEMNGCNVTRAVTLHMAAGTYTFPAGVQAVIDNFNGRILGGYPAGGGTRNAATNPVILRGNVQVLKNVTIDGVRVVNP